MGQVDVQAWIDAQNAPDDEPSEAENEIHAKNRGAEC